jgi:hypothetical protein
VLEVDGAVVAQSRMQATWIIEPIDVIDDGSRGLFVSLVLVVVNLLDLETAAETFHRSVVIAIGLRRVSNSVARLN